tara:strand:- start:44 stop:169 length:126 start_codon:yes stop_codon:yes gene_type:complete
VLIAIATIVGAADFAARSWMNDDAGVVLCGGFVGSLDHLDQ